MFHVRLLELEFELGIITDSSLRYYKDFVLNLIVLKNVLMFGFFYGCIGLRFMEKDSRIM